MLQLFSSEYFGDAGKADWNRLPALEQVWLSDTKVSGDIVELVGKLPPTLKELGLGQDQTGWRMNSGRRAARHLVYSNPETC